MARRRNTLTLDPLSIGLLAAFAVLAIITAIFAFIVIRNVVLGWSTTSLPGVAIDSSGKPQIGEAGGTPLDEPLQGSNDPAAHAWDGTSRVTMLLMGLDYRDWEAGEIPRTDTMILLTLDPISRTAGMLTIPRDMWVAIPGFDHGKINTAYFLGESFKVPGGGPGLAVQTVEQFIGVPIHFYAQVDFFAFVKFIDEIDGVKIDVPEKIKIDPIGPSNEVWLEPGRYNLNGDVVLAYARARYTEGGDFDRAKRQQQVIMAIRERLFEVDRLPMLIRSAPALYRDLSEGIKTNLTLQQAVQLALLAQQVPEKNIRKAVIPPGAVSSAMSPDGLDILVPYPDEIRLIRDNVFTTGGPVGPKAVAEDPAALMQAEKARVVVQNGTALQGLANRTGEYLRSQGMNVVEENNADRTYDSSLLYIFSGKPYTARYLADMMNIPTSNIFNQFNPDAQADILIIVGNNWANSNPMP